ncbi:MAG: helix-turn-helix transcriptional regulator [Lachnospiraceae bacterium]|nr:helix-turn-helix transcriptional regulator [Lachnospiraceae bacterium]
MNLYTKSYNPDWGRIVDMVVEKCDKLSEYIKDKTVFKVILHEKGEIELAKGEDTFRIKEPSLIILSDRDISDFKTIKKGNNTILYFMPSLVREEFSLKDLYGHKYDEAFGTTIYQDYHLVKDFFKTEELEKKIFPLSLIELNKIRTLIDSIEKELTMQYDGFWPCRSRSYLLELLFFIQFLFGKADEKNQTVSPDDEIFSQVCEYLNEHLGDDISLESLTKEFSINRNKLNSIFETKTGKTCLNHLTDLRIDMAKMILSNTEIPIGEVSNRVGYPDSNYFTKIFKKIVKTTPSVYRKNNITCR